MNKIKSHLFFKLTSLVVIFSLLSFDISWSYPSLKFSTSPTLPTISGQSIFQGKMLTPDGEKFRVSIAPDATLQNAILDIAKYFYTEKLPISALDPSITHSYENLACAKVEHIFTLEYLIDKIKNPQSKRKLPKSIKKDDIIVLPYNKHNAKSLVLIAKRESTSAQTLKGQTLFESEQYIITLLPKITEKVKESQDLTNTNSQLLKAQSIHPPTEITTPVSTIIPTPEKGKWGTLENILLALKNSKIITNMLAAVFFLPYIDEFSKKYPALNLTQSVYVKNLMGSFTPKKLLGIIVVALCLLKALDYVQTVVIPGFQLTSTNSGTREKATKKLKRYGKYNETAEILKCLTDLKYKNTSPEKQKLAWETLGNMSELNDPTIQKRAVQALGQVLGYTNDLNSNILQDISPVSWEIAKFEKLAVPEIESALFEQHRFSSQYGAIIAVNFLQIDPKEKIALIEKIISHDNIVEHQIRIYALNLYIKLHDSTNSHINKNEKLEEYVRLLLQSNDYKVRTTAMDFLKKCGTLTPEDRFDKALCDIRDPGIDIQLSGIKALGKIRYNNIPDSFFEEAETVLNNIARFPKYDIQLRLSAVETLFKIASTYAYDGESFLNTITTTGEPTVSKHICSRAEALLKKFYHKILEEDPRADVTNLQYFIKKEQKPFSVLNKKKRSASVTPIKHVPKKNQRTNYPKKLIIPFVVATPTISSLILFFFKGSANAENIFQIVFNSTKSNPANFTQGIAIICLCLMIFGIGIILFKNSIINATLEEKDTSTKEQKSSPNNRVEQKQENVKIQSVATKETPPVQEQKFSTNSTESLSQSVKQPSPEPLQDEVLALYNAANSEVNNIRGCLINKTNAIRKFLKSIDGFTDDLRREALTKKDLSAKIYTEIEKTLETIGYIKKLEKTVHLQILADKVKVPEKINQHIDYISKHLPELEPESIINSLIALARLKKKHNQNLIVAFETDWIPNKTDQTQHDLLFPIFKELLPPDGRPNEMSRLEKKLHAMKLDNVFFVHSTSKNLAGEIIQKAYKTATEFSNIIVMASQKTIDSSAFNILKSTPEKKKAFIASINTSKTKYCKEGNYNLIQKVLFIKMLSLTIELALGLKSKDLSIISDYDEENRIVFLLPDADFFEYNKLMTDYKAEAQAFTSL
ncbi:MAG: hypothetical protein ABIH85_01590 [Candidatus Omnitrophota bacterium]